MIKVLSVDNMRKSDAHTIESGITGKELMYRAGVGVVKAIEDNTKLKGLVAIVCGSGNNAGDGYVIAKVLHSKGYNCTIFRLSEKASENGSYYLKQCLDSKIDVLFCNDDINFSGYSTIIDCIFGTGFKGDVSGLAATIIEQINQSNAYVVSVDINSGLNGDNGLSKLCVHSDLTVSIGDFKPGHFLNMAKDVMKTKCNVDIGIKPLEKPFNLVEQDDFKSIFKARPNYSNKGSYGYIALIGGSRRYCGAIRLASLANVAMRSGAGVVQIALPSSLIHDVTPQILESTIYPLSDKDGEVLFVEKEVQNLIKRVKCIAFGMGIGVTEETAKMLTYILDNYAGRLIIDADGLTVLSQLIKENPKILTSTKSLLVLTPHLKEFSRLTGLSIDEIQENPIEHAIKYVQNCSANSKITLLLKGPTTIVTNGVETYLTDAGCAGMATAGSGDVLSGILTAICAWDNDLTLSTIAGAYINGKAGEYAQEKTNPISMIASDTVNGITKVISEYFKYPISQEYDDFLAHVKQLGHGLLILYFYNGSELTTKIAVDKTSKTLAILNQSSNPLFTAFGVNTHPSWNDFQYFLEDRCIPRDRDGLKYYLEELGLTSYEPLEIIRKTQGRMAEDHCWIKIVEETND
jgi:ADP-dependent NAD(P)H-hydrate dehydratase / NAD(P)H-hydrate epimerase